MRVASCGLFRYIGTSLNLTMLSKKLITEILKEANHFPRHALRVMTTVVTRKIFPHKKYTFGKHPRQYLCWFEPEKDTRNQIIIFYHGGAWTFGTPEIFSNRAKILTQQGYQVIMPSHRKLPFNSYKEIREDLILTLTKVYELMAKKGILHKKIILGGMSSGGNLIGLLLFDNTFLKQTNFTTEHFVGGFFLAAPLSLEGMTESFVLELYAGKKNTEIFKKASPINFLPDTFSKPVLIVHGTEDGIVKYQSTIDFVKALEKVSTILVDFYTIKGGSHLKAASWVYKNNALRKKILSWLGEL